MTKDAILKAQHIQHLCIFCASRLATTAPPPALLLPPTVIAPRISTRSYTTTQSRKSALDNARVASTVNPGTVSAARAQLFAAERAYLKQLKDYNGLDFDRIRSGPELVGTATNGTTPQLQRAASQALPTSSAQKAASSLPRTWRQQSSSQEPAEPAAVSYISSADQLAHNPPRDGIVKPLRARNAPSRTRHTEPVPVAAKSEASQSQSLPYVAKHFAIPRVKKKSSSQNASRTTGGLQDASNISHENSVARSPQKTAVAVMSYSVEEKKNESKSKRKTSMRNKINERFRQTIDGTHQKLATAVTTEPVTNTAELTHGHRIKDSNLSSIDTKDPDIDVREQQPVYPQSVNTEKVREPGSRADDLDLAVHDLLSTPASNTVSKSHEGNTSSFGVRMASQETSSSAFGMSTRREPNSSVGSGSSLDMTTGDDTTERSRSTQREGFELAKTQEALKTTASSSFTDSLTHLFPNAVSLDEEMDDFAESASSLTGTTPAIQSPLRRPNTSLRTQDGEPQLLRSTASRSDKNVSQTFQSIMRNVLAEKRAAAREKRRQTIRWSSTVHCLPRRSITSPWFCTVQPIRTYAQSTAKPRFTIRKVGIGEQSFERTQPSRTGRPEPRKTWTPPKYQPPPQASKRRDPPRDHGAFGYKSYIENQQHQPAAQASVGRNSPQDNGAFRQKSHVHHEQRLAAEVDMSTQLLSRLSKTYTPSAEPEQRTSDAEADGSTDLASRLSARFAISEIAEDDTRSSKNTRSRKQKGIEKESRWSDKSPDDVDGQRRGRRADVDEYDPIQVKRRAEKVAEQQRKHRERAAAAAAKRAADGKPITIPAFITVTNLAQLVGARYTPFSNRLKTLGFDDIFANKVLDIETASLIAQEYGFNPGQDATVKESTKRDLLPLPDADPAETEHWPIRPPVVTIMGHVDHGKTTILDFLRKANVVAGEAGGITQHIGAFSVRLPATGRTITFLDTPGHAAFLAMRQRGANVTDIVVLVVAADDSVMPQTLEAMKHASAAQVPIIVAINKVDKPDANILQVKQDLSRHGIEIEDYGGDVQVVEVSGKTGQGMDALEEAIITQAELLDRRADVSTKVDGWIVEATTKAAGRVATVLVRRGTLRVGSILVAGQTWARVKSLHDDTGAEVSEASPGTPVEVHGWREQPAAGDRVLEAESEQQAASVVDYRNELVERRKLVDDTEAINKARQEHISARERVAADGTAAEDEKSAGYVEEETGQQIIPIIIKADVSGSAEAVASYLEGVGSSLIAPKVLQSLVGPVSESDIEYAAAVRGLIVSFNIETEERMKSLAAMRKIQILENNIIYRVVEDVKEVLESKLPPLITQRVLGEADIAQIFKIGLGKGKNIQIAGCKVRNGVISRSSRVRVMRGTAKIYDGTLSSLKNVKKDVNEMRKGSECGIGFMDWSEFKPGDVIQTYEEISESQKL